MAPTALVIKNTFYFLPEEPQSTCARRSHSEPPSPTGSEGTPSPTGSEGSETSQNTGSATPSSNASSRCARGGERQARGSAGRTSKAGRTTVYLKNVPCFMDRSVLAALLDSYGYKGKYDFLYAPMDFDTSQSVGYAFVNFRDATTAEAFRAKFDGFRDWPVASRKILEVVWSTTQGFAKNVKSFRYKRLPEQFRPLIFEGGRDSASW